MQGGGGEKSTDLGGALRGRLPGEEKGFVQVGGKEQPWMGRRGWLGASPREGMLLGLGELGTMPRAPSQVTFSAEALVWMWG